MTDITGGSVAALHRCPGYRKPMVPLASGELIANLGLKDDMHALPDSARQILLVEAEALDDLRLQPGQVKENITTRGVALMKLVPRQLVQVGPDAVLEIVKSCSPCSRIEELRPGLLREIAGRRGMLARVLRGGRIAAGDPITLLAR